MSAPPPLPFLQPGQRVRVVDAKSKAMLWMVGKPGRVYGHNAQQRFKLDNSARSFPVDSRENPQPPGSKALIVEPIGESVVL